MKVYTCDNFPGVCPTGTAAVIVATNRGHARRLLAIIAPEGLRGDETFEELDTTHARAIVLQDGDY